MVYLDHPVNFAPLLAGILAQIPNVSGIALTARHRGEPNRRSYQPNTRVYSATEALFHVRSTVVVLDPDRAVPATASIVDRWFGAAQTGAQLPIIVDT
jgi:hypothetical protein